jgi:hypothetical protein
MASTILDPIADVLVLELAALTVLGDSVKGYLWSPRQMTKVPAGVVEIPSVGRVGPDEAESQLSSDDWNVTYPVVLYVDATRADTSQAALVEFLEDFIAAIDANPSLTNTVLDAKVLSAEPFLDLTEQARPLVGYECEVAVLKLVSD